MSKQSLTPQTSAIPKIIHGLSTTHPLSLERDTLFAKTTIERQKAGPKSSSIGYYDIEKNIGEGNFAKVKLAVHSLTGEKVRRNLR
ncbi:hypothetical protein HMI55_002010 [Coelomomyces lativittatus]|nr:hypothetical protein HMI55_002010 [Coelomomyces lativittatus]